MQQSLGNRWSLWVCVLCMGVMAYTSFIFYPRWNKPDTEAAISFDVAGYYWYLPSIFIYHDLKGQHFADGILKKYQPSPDFQQAFQIAPGQYVMKYSSGMALMFLPAFTIAHGLAPLLGYPADGFSPPYQLSLQIWGFLIAMVGFWFLRKLLLQFYEDKVVAVALLVLVIGTNYPEFSVINIGMSHNWLFVIYVFLLLSTIRFYETFKVQYVVSIGLLVGLATLTRPTEIISCLIPLLWGLESLRPKDALARVKLLVSKLKLFIPAMVCAAAVISIQLIYWKYASGHWIFYSYGDQHLYFRSPNFYNYTLSYDSGWLRYTPIMIFAFVGLIPFLFYGKNKVAITTFFLFNYYVVCCWSIWWYGGRAMVQSYPVLLFPMASLIKFAFERKFISVVLGPFVLLFIYLNCWFTYQMHKGKLYDCVHMTGEYYWKVIGRWKTPDEYAFLKDKTDWYDGAFLNKKLIYANDFEGDSTLPSIKLPISGSRSLELNDTSTNSIPFGFRWQRHGERWIVATADFRSDMTEYNNWLMAQFIVDVYSKGTIKKTNMIRVHRLLADHDTKNLSLYVDLGTIDADSVVVGFWNANNKKKIWIDNIKVYSIDK